MSHDEKPVGISQAAAQLAVVRLTLGIVARTLAVIVTAQVLVSLTLKLFGIPEGVVREVLEAGFVTVIALPVLYVTTLRPVTELTAKQTAAAAERRFTAVAQSAHDGIIIFDQNARILFANKAAEWMHGFETGCLQGKPLENLIPNERRQQFLKDFETFLQTGKSNVIGKGPTERVGLRRNGESFPVEVSISALVEGKNRQFVVVVRDISARKQAEHEIQERTTRLNALIANSPLAIVVLDKNQRVQMCNPAFEVLFQYRGAEIAGMDLDSLVASGQLLEEAIGFTKLGVQGQVAHAITQRRRKDGSLLDVEMHGVPLLIGGQVEGLYAIYQDQTERKRLKLYEQILPVCCVCGKIRDDQGVESGEGTWDRLDHYIATHTDAKLSHTFCPPCLEEYRQREGLSSAGSSV